MQIVRHVGQGPTVDISQLYPQSVMGAQEDLNGFAKGDAHRDRPLNPLFRAKPDCD
jgi:hypothetical protein